MSKELNKAPVEQAGGDERDLQGAQGERECGHAACKSLGEHHPFCKFVSDQDRAALAQPSPAQAEQAEAERLDWPSALLDVAVLQEALTSRDSDERMKNMDAGEVIRRAFGKLTEIRAQHERIVGALRTKADQLREALEWRKENQAGQRELLRSVTAERDAALARVAELERELRNEENAHTTTIEQRDNAEHWADQLANAIAERFGVDIGEHSNLNCPWNEALVWMQQPPAQAQHSVPEGWMLVPVEPTQAQLSAGQTAWLADPMRRSTTLYRAMLAAAPQPVTEGE
ncbi:TPA: hypothetical protein L6A01_27295 [Pseudomonas aeruginosa]|nr:hypothetical protein [Pseudomonas aeruginosa]